MLFDLPLIGWIAVVLATWEIVEILHHGSLFESWRNCARNAVPGINDWLDSEPPAGQMAAFLHKAGKVPATLLLLIVELFMCPFCLTVWISSLTTIVLIAEREFPSTMFRAGTWLIAVFAVARLANVANDVLYARTRTPKDAAPEDWVPVYDENNPPPPKSDGTGDEADSPWVPVFPDESGSNPATKVPSGTPFDKRICMSLQELASRTVGQNPEVRSVTILVDYHDGLAGPDTSSVVLVGKDPGVLAPDELFGIQAQLVTLQQALMARIGGVLNKARQQLAVLLKEQVRHETEPQKESESHEKAEAASDAGPGRDHSDGARPGAD